MPVLNLPSVYIGDDGLWQIPSLAFYLFSHVIQGKPDIDRLQTIAIEHLAERDFLHILAVMCSPDDPAIAAQLDEALGSEELYTPQHSFSAKASNTGYGARMDAATALSIIDRKSPTENPRAIF